MKEKYNIKLLDYKNIDDTTLFYRTMDDDKMINLGVQYYEDGEKSENIQFYSYPYLSSLKYQILLSHGCVVVIENKKIVCLYQIAEKNKKSKEFLYNLNKNIKDREITLEKVYKPENILR